MHLLRPILVLACLMHAGCASTQARAQIGGRAPRVERGEGEYCVHCSGGPVRSAWLPFADAEDGEGIEVELYGSCPVGETVSLGRGRRIVIALEDRDLTCRSGTITIGSCSIQEMELSFQAECEGGRVEGSFAGPLTYFAGIK